MSSIGRFPAPAGFVLDWQSVWAVLDHPIVTLGKTPITAWTLIYSGILALLLIRATGVLKRKVIAWIAARQTVEIGVLEAVGTIARYIALAVGLIVILQTAGVDLSAISTLAGALGIGIGLGLQNITNNFVSGLIILLTRPIKVGDRIEVGSVSGDVVEISARATTVVTNDDIAVIVPNSEFISSRVINWSYNEPTVRFNIPVGVAYQSDPEVVKKLLLETALAHPGVLKDRAPDVLLQEFGDNAVIFILRVWTRKYTKIPGVLRSELNYAVHRTFREHGIEFPFPQRDIHIRDGRIRLESNVAAVSEN